MNLKGGKLVLETWGRKAPSSPWHGTISAASRVQWSTWLVQLEYQSTWRAVSFLETYALRYANRANDMKYLSHKSASLLSMVMKQPSDNLVSHAHNMSPGKTCLVRPTRNFWSHGNYISQSKLLSWHSHFIHQPVESFLFMHGISLNSCQLRNTKKISVSELSQPLVPPGICHLQKPPSDQSPSCAAPWVDDPEKITLWLSNRILLKEQVKHRPKRTDFGVRQTYG